jgi:Pyruvate kinase, barrel domain
MLDAGMTAARFDLSWGSLKYHLKSLEVVHKTAMANGKLCAMCLEVGGRTCKIVQPFTLDGNDWPQFKHTIRIECDQEVILTAESNAEVVVPEVREFNSYGAFESLLRPLGVQRVDHTHTCRPRSQLRATSNDPDRASAVLGIGGCAACLAEAAAAHAGARRRGGRWALPDD